MHRRQKNSTLYCERIEKRKGGWRGTQERLGAWECVSIKSVDFLLGHDEQATKSNIKHGNDSRSGCRGLSRMLLLGAFSIIDLPRLVWPTRWTVTRKASWAWFMNIFLRLVHVLSTIAWNVDDVLCWFDFRWSRRSDRSNLWNYCQDIEDKMIRYTVNHIFSYRTFYLFYFC